MVSPHEVPENVVDENAPSTTNLTFLPIRGGVVMMNNKTVRAEDDCDGLCTDEKCQQAHPDLCGPHEDPNYCWVGCYCTGYKYNFCTCLCTA
ncbi:unnamed protein product [Linum trigynum]|uniref:Uncharacterized protein n=1 Tax=Linum trigynum TaxID=586398 RepID=A0AAV2D266_9ROSI